MEQMKPLTSFGRDVKRELNERRITTRTFAKEIGIHENTLKDIFSGKIPGYEHQKRIAQYFKKQYGVKITVEDRRKRVSKIV